MDQFTKTFNNLTFTNLKIFWISLVGVFLMVALPYLGFRPQGLISPKPTINVWSTIESKLNQKTNHIKIKKPAALITPTWASPDFTQASAYGVVDFDQGEILLSKNLSQRLPIASLTKLMTAIITLDLTTSEDQFTISSAAASIQPTKMGLVVGQTWNRNELLTALLLTSANDAAEALKEGINQKYGDSVFIKAMNEKAKILGLKNTSFSNPQGFDDPTNFSSVEDLATLSHFAITNYPLIREIVEKDYQFYAANSQHKQADLYNWNGLMGVYPGLKGIKIGNTEEAGVTTIVLAQRQGKNILTVLLGAPGVLQRDLWAAELLDLGFSQLANLPPVGITEKTLQQKYSSWQYWH